MKMNLFELICRAFTIADEMPCLFITSEWSEGEHFAVEFTSINGLSSGLTVAKITPRIR